MDYPLAIVCIFVYYIRLILLHDYERQLASKVGYLKDYLGIKWLTVALTVPSFVCLFVCIVCSLRVVC